MVTQSQDATTVVRTRVDDLGSGLTKFFNLFVFDELLLDVFLVNTTLTFPSTAHPKPLYGQMRMEIASTTYVEVEYVRF